MIESEHEQETSELQQSWMELRKVVRCMYGHREDCLSEEYNINNLPDDETVKKLVKK